MDPLTVASSQLEELISRLTPRQLEIVELLARGHDYQQTGTLLSIGFDTVRKHVYHACYKLDLENRIQLIVLYAMWRITNDKG